MADCVFEAIEQIDGMYVAVCKNCNESIRLPVDPSTARRQCTINRKASPSDKYDLENYAVWLGETKGWEFKRLRKGMDLEPDKFEVYQPDSSRIGTALHNIIRIAGYETDNEQCGCKELRNQFDLASIPFMKKHVERAAKLVQYSASKAGHQMSFGKIKIGILLAIKHEKLRLFVSKK